MTFDEILADCTVIPGHDDFSDDHPWMPQAKLVGQPVADVPPGLTSMLHRLFQAKP